MKEKMERPLKGKAGNLQPTCGLTFLCGLSHDLVISQCRDKNFLLLKNSNTMHSLLQFDTTVGSRILADTAII